MSKNNIITRLSYELTECEIGTPVRLNFTNGETYMGFYEGFDEDEIILRSISKEHRVGLPFDMLDNFTIEDFK